MSFKAEPPRPCWGSLGSGQGRGPAGPESAAGREPARGLGAARPPCPADGGTCWSSSGGSEARGLPGEAAVSWAQVRARALAWLPPLPHGKRGEGVQSPALTACAGSPHAALVPYRSRAELACLSASSICRQVHGLAKSVLENVSEAQANNLKQVLIPVAGALKEQLEEFIPERSKNGSIQAADEYSHLHQAVPVKGCLCALPLG